MSNQPNQRRIIFINKAFQGRFILNVLLLILLSGLCSALLVYWITGGDLQAESQTAHENITNALDHLGISLVLSNLAAMLIVGALAVFMVLYASHKIAGPLYRFEKICHQIGDGQLDAMTALREHDQLQDLGTAFTGMVDKLRQRHIRQLELIEKITLHIDELEKDASLSSDQAVHIANIRLSLDQLSNE
jgi:methyl-accepting chemotaxis protein